MTDTSRYEQLLAEVAREFACSVTGCREVWRKFISVHLFHYFWVNGAPCFESPMTPLSDTHARARKLKDVIDKRVSARVSKKSRFLVNILVSRLSQNFTVRRSSVTPTPQKIHCCFPFSLPSGFGARGGTFFV